MCGLPVISDRGTAATARTDRRRRDDQRRDADAVDHAHRAGAVIIVFGVAEAEVRRGVRLVELTNGPDRLQRRQVERAGAARVLAPHAALQVADEIPLIQRVPRPLEGPRALADLDDRRHGGDADQRRRRAAAVLARELQREVPAERIAGDRDRRQPVDVGQLVHDVRGVGGQPRVKEPFRQMLRIAAVALVQPHDVHAARERFRGEAAHVVRAARSVQAVQRDERRVLPRPRLPMTIGDNPRARRDIEVPPRRRRQPGKIARVPPAVQRHVVTIAQEIARHETVHRSQSYLPYMRYNRRILEAFMRVSRLLTIACATVVTVSLTAAPQQQTAPAPAALASTRSSNSTRKMSASKSTACAKTSSA